MGGTTGKEGEGYNVPRTFAACTSVDYSMWGLLQEKMYKVRISDLDELKQRLTTEWAKLDHVVIVAVIRQRRR